ncbi:MAG TPA: hypothetical protein VE863_16130 [Pyrinomonadaceae bacterium]|nr:hypothetical protein [Pyrinomonadaceae bacterium]
MTRTLTIILLGLTLAIGCYAQGAARSASDDEILRALMPNGNSAKVDNLKQFKRSEEIRALKAAQARATGERAGSIIWLLAALKYHYTENRTRLIQIERSCHRQPYPKNFDCYDLTAARFIDLFRRGDNSLLKYLFDIWPHSDGALSEELGGFYSDTLASQPRVFLRTLRNRSLKDQKAISVAAAYEDGGGMGPQRLHQVRRILRNSIARKDGLSPVAKVCLTQINLAQKKIAANK